LEREGKKESVISKIVQNGIGGKKKASRGSVEEEERRTEDEVESVDVAESCDWRGEEKAHVSLEHKILQNEGEYILREALIVLGPVPREKTLFWEGKKGKRLP